MHHRQPTKKVCDGQPKFIPSFPCHPCHLADHAWHRSYACRRADPEGGSALTVITPDRENRWRDTIIRVMRPACTMILCARCMVLDDGTTKACMISLDLIGTSRELVVEARQLINKLHGIPADHIMISATHSHTGPIIGASKHAQALGAGTRLSQELSCQPARQTC